MKVNTMEDNDLEDLAERSGPRDTDTKARWGPSPLARAFPWLKIMESLNDYEPDQKLIDDVLRLDELP